MIIYNEYQPIRLDADVPEDARYWRNHPSIRKWCRQFTLIDEYQHEAWLEAQSESPSIKMFGVMNRTEYIGVCGLTSIDYINRNAEFSLYIEPTAQRKGFGKKALLSLLRHGFEDFGLKRIWGETYEGNPALKTFTSIGMRKEGTLRSAYFRRGKFIDAYRVAMLDEDWFRKNTKADLRVLKNGKPLR